MSARREQQRSVRIEYPDLKEGGREVQESGYRVGCALGAIRAARRRAGSKHASSDVFDGVLYLLERTFRLPLRRLHVVLETGLRLRANVPDRDPGADRAYNYQRR